MLKEYINHGERILHCGHMYVCIEKFSENLKPGKDWKEKNPPKDAVLMKRNDIKNKKQFLPEFYDMKDEEEFWVFERQEIKYECRLVIFTNLGIYVLDDSKNCHPCDNFCNVELLCRGIPEIKALFKYEDIQKQVLYNFCA